MANRCLMLELIINAENVTQYAEQHIKYYSIKSTSMIVCNVKD